MDWRQRLELIFWAARQTLGIVVLAAFSLSTVIALINGDQTLLDRLLDALPER